MFYEYGGYKDYPRTIIVQHKNTRIFWSNKKTLPKGKYVIEYEFTSGNYSMKELSNSLVRVKNSGKGENLVFTAVRRFKVPK